MPVGVATLTPRPQPEKPARTPDPVRRVLAAVAAPAPETPIPPAAEPPKEDVRRKAWLRVRLELQDPGEPYEVTAVVFSSDGQAEAHVEYQNVDRFELGPLTPGKKGVVVYSRRGDLAPVSAVVVMGDTEDTELVLGPGRAVPVEGVVVNAQGRGVPGVDVEFSVLLPVGLSFLPRKNHSFGGLFGGESHTGGGTRIRHRKFSVIPAGNAIRLTQSGDTDDQGHFSLPLYSRDDGVTLRLKKGTELLKEETVLPSRSPLRLIVPGADDPSK